MMEPQLKLRVVKITRTLQRQPVIVMADRIRLEQVIINLLRNALDATQPALAGAGKAGLWCDRAVFADLWLRMVLWLACMAGAAAVVALTCNKWRMVNS